MRYFILLTVWFSFSTTYAAGVCDDLATFSCAPGSYDDGTGVVRSETEVASEVRSFMDRTRASLREEVVRTLQRPDSEFFRDNALSLLGLQDSPVCARENPDAPLPQACVQNLTEGVVDLVARQTVGSQYLPSPSYSFRNATDLRYVQSDRNFQGLVTFVREKADRELVNHTVIDRVRDNVFPDVKRLMIARISEMNIPEQQKRYMFSKINAIQFSGFNCSDAKTPEEYRIDHLLTENASYNPLRNTFKFCNGYALRSTSAFSIVTSIAHELSHSIDPCRLAAGPSERGFSYTSTDLEANEQENPFTNVITCLRSPHSINARNFDRERNNQAQLQNAQYAQAAAQAAAYRNSQAFSGSGVALGGQFGTPPASGTVAAPPVSVPGTVPVFGGGMLPAGQGIGGGMAGAPPAAPSFCENDQMTESFPDWMAAEVLPRYIEANYNLTREQYQLGYGNMRRMLCDSSGQNQGETDEHPPIRDRINKIFLPNPNIRRQMGCSTPARSAYCDSERGTSVDGSASPGGAANPGAPGSPGSTAPVPNPAPAITTPQPAAGSIR